MVGCSFILWFLCHSLMGGLFQDLALSWWFLHIQNKIVLPFVLTCPFPV